MGRLPLNLQKIESRFLRHLTGRDSGLNYTALVNEYSEGFSSERTARYHIERLRSGINSGRVRSIVTWETGERRMFGDALNAAVREAKADAENPPPPPRAAVMVGPYFGDCPVRGEWTKCPVTRRVRKVTIITVGVGDFMECGICNRVHFLGVNPQMRDRRLRVMDVDPLVNSADYADALSVQLMDGAKCEIERVNRGGSYVGLLFRQPFDDPEEDQKEKDQKEEDQKRYRREWEKAQRRVNRKTGRARKVKPPSQ